MIPLLLTTLLCLQEADPPPAPPPLAEHLEQARHEARLEILDALLLDWNATDYRDHADDLKDAGRLDLAADDPARPILLAVSDNGPQMTCSHTAQFMAIARIAQHFGRPGTPNDQSWIESFFGHLKGEHPHLDTITDPADMRRELEVRREHYNTIRLHEGIG